MLICCSLLFAQEKKKKTCEPVWNETLYLMVQEPKTQTARLTCYDQDLVSVKVSNRTCNQWPLLILPFRILFVEPRILIWTAAMQRHVGASSLQEIMHKGRRDLRDGLM